MSSFSGWIKTIDYSRYQFSKAVSRRIKHHELVGYLVELSIQPVKKVTTGTSLEQRELFHFSWGNGPVSVLLWSQMHGNEPTATLAILDFLNFIQIEKESEFLKWLSSKLTLHFIPMLNPDGAERFQRRNSLGIDLNRDALDLCSPESRFLKSVKEAVNPVWGFNLHDQNPRYSVGSTDKVAVISLLAPAFDSDRNDNQVRNRAKKLAGFLRQEVEARIGPHVGRYDDAFGSRCFGDNMQSWGVSTVLIESGGWYQSPDKPLIRELNFRMFLAAFNAIAADEIEELSTEPYESIPFNGSLMTELKLENVRLGDRRTPDPMLDRRAHPAVSVDLAINYPPMMDWVTGVERMIGVVADIGDLSPLKAMATMDFSAYLIEPMKGNFMPMPVTTDVIRRSVLEGYDTFFYPSATDPKRLRSQIAIAVSLFREDFFSEHHTTSLLPGERASFRILDPGSREVLSIWINGFEVYNRDSGWQKGEPWVMPNRVKALEVEL